MLIDVLVQDVKTLALPGGRVVGTTGHDAARCYIVERLTSLGLAPYTGETFTLPYTANGVGLTNIVGRVPGTERELPPLLVHAHYDTCGPQPGADDNAAAIAIALSTAQRLLAAPLRRDVVFCFPDAEEPPHFLTSSMGSTYFYEQQRVTDFHCAVAMDLVGHDLPIPGLEELLIITGMESDPGLEQVLVSCAAPVDLELLPTLTRYVGDLSDYAVHRREERPYLFLTCAHWEHYHEETDTPDRLNYEKMAVIVEYLVSLLRALDAVSLDGPFEGYDSTPTELLFMKKTLSPILPHLGLPLQTREDIDRLAALMVQVFDL